MAKELIAPVRVERSWLVVCLKVDGAYQAQVIPTFSNENLVAKLRDPKVIGVHAFNKRESAEIHADELCQAYKRAKR